MMAEHGIKMDHSTVHRWVLHFSSKLLERFNRRKRQVTRRWNLDETYVKVKGAWLYLYRAIDSNVSGKQTPSGGSGDRSDIGSGHNELL